MAATKPLTTYVGYAIVQDPSRVSPRLVEFPIGLEIDPSPDDPTRYTVCLLRHDPANGNELASRSITLTPEQSADLAWIIDAL